MQNRFFSFVVIVALLVVALPASGALAQGDGFFYFTKASSSCEQGAFTFDNNEFVGETSVFQPAEQLPQLPPEYSTIVEAFDSEGTLLGSKTIDLTWDELFNPVSGTVNYTSTPVGSVTFMLYWRYIGLSSPSLAPAEYHLSDVVTVPVDCTTVIPGCTDSLMLTADAAVGSFKRDADIYWAPAKLTHPVLEIEASKTAWVLGQDATEEYYKIIWACDYVWVEKDTMGPNFDELWNGAPLPTSIVK